LIDFMCSSSIFFASSELFNQTLASKRLTKKTMQELKPTSF
jgi:hypothetical protein